MTIFGGFTGFRRASAIVALVAASIVFALPPAAQEASPPASPSPAAELESAKLVLDEVEAPLKQPELTAAQLIELSQTLGPLRDQLRARLADLESSAAQAETKLKQLGPAPAASATPESAAIAAERAELNKQFAELDALLKQTRLLALRVEQISARISERRRDLFARQLFAPAQSVLAPSFWGEAAQAFGVEMGALGRLLASWWEFIREQDRVGRAVAAVLTVAVFGFVVVMGLRRWRRRIRARITAQTPLAKAVVSLVVFLRTALMMPVITVLSFDILRLYGLMIDRLEKLEDGVELAVIIASFGHAVGRGLLAPEESWRRLIAFDDDVARAVHRSLVWGARGLGVFVLALVMHKVFAAPPLLSVATNMLFGLFIAALMLRLLWSLRPAADQDVSATAARAPWVRGLAWLALVVLGIALAAGYARFAAFLAERLVTGIALLGAFYLVIVFINSVIADTLTGETPRGRAIAANLGISPRRIGFIGTLLSGGISLLLMLVALVLVVTPWDVAGSDYLNILNEAASGFSIGDYKLSIGAIFAAAIAVVVVLVFTRVVQGWLEKQLLPRTEIEPSLQQSILTIAGYVGAIAAISLALAQLGIDLQKIAFIAGALSVGIGFGLQSIVSNFVSGLILLAERPIRVGDWVVVKGEEGYVRRIRVRATEIETFDRASVIIPNADLISNAVKNWTHLNTTGRVTVKVGVAYGSDPEQVRDILLACADAHKQVLKFPTASALLLNFGDSALEFALRCYISDINQTMTVRSDLNFAIFRKFRESGIEIPFPQREVRLISPDGHGAGTAGTS